jgi:hypothetical protein
MTKTLAILVLFFAAASLGACVSSGVNGAHSGYYVGRFDNDENRPPMLVDNSGRSPAPLQNVVYGDGEH